MVTYNFYKETYDQFRNRLSAIDVSKMYHGQVQKPQKRDKNRGQGSSTDLPVLLKFKVNTNGEVIINQQGLGDQRESWASGETEEQNILKTISIMQTSPNSQRSSKAKLPTIKSKNKTVPGSKNTTPLYSPDITPPQSPSYRQIDIKLASIELPNPG